MCFFVHLINTHGIIFSITLKIVWVCFLVIEDTYINLPLQNWNVKCQIFIMFSKPKGVVKAALQ